MCRWKDTEDMPRFSKQAMRDAVACADAYSVGEAARRYHVRDIVIQRWRERLSQESNSSPEEICTNELSAWISRRIECRHRPSLAEISMKGLAIARRVGAKSFVPTNCWGRYFLNKANLRQDWQNYMHHGKENCVENFSTPKKLSPARRNNDRATWTVFKKELTSWIKSTLERGQRLTLLQISTKGLDIRRRLNMPRVTPTRHWGSWFLKRCCSSMLRDKWSSTRPVKGRRKRKKAVVNHNPVADKDQVMEKAIKFAEVHGNQAAIAMFGVSESSFYKRLMRNFDDGQESGSKESLTTCTAESQSTVDRHQEQCNADENSTHTNPNASEAQTLSQTPVDTVISLPGRVCKPSSKQQCLPPSYEAVVSEELPWSEMVTDVNDTAEVGRQIPKSVECVDGKSVIEIDDSSTELGDQGLFGQDFTRNMDLQHNMASVTNPSHSSNEDDAPGTSTGLPRTHTAPLSIVVDNNGNGTVCSVPEQKDCPRQPSVDAEERKLATYYRSIVEEALYYKEMLDICKAILGNRKLPSEFPRQPNFVAYQSLVDKFAGADGLQNSLDALNKLEEKSKTFVPGNECRGNRSKTLTRLLKEAYVLSLDEN